MRILVVDDYADNRSMLATVLATAGYGDVLTASSAHEAFGLLSVDDAAAVDPGFDLILMDVKMPEVDGIEACRRIKACERLRDIPIIMVTGQDETSILQ